MYCFTFLFTPILGTFMPTILEMNNINLADLASSAANAISMVNNEIISFGEMVITEKSSISREWRRVW